MPSKANKNFPYHVRTNQIGMMELAGISGNNSLYEFGHHPYAPGGPMGVRDVPFELFTVSRHLDDRNRVIDYESQAFPHQIPSKYAQTLLLPITMKNLSNESSPNSSGSSTPRVVEEIIEPSQSSRSKSADVGKVDTDRIAADDRKIYSADCAKRDATPSGIYLNLELCTLPNASLRI